METVVTIAALIISGIVVALVFRHNNTSSKETEIQDLETKQAIKHAEVQQKRENYEDAKKAFKDKYSSLTNSNSTGNKPRG